MPIEPWDPDKIVLPPMNENIRSLYMQLLEQQHKYNEVLYEVGKRKLFVFNKYVLGVEDGKQPLGQFHKDLCNFVQDNTKRKKLILIPRGHLKSTLITIGYSLFRIINDQNIRVLILNATWQMAVDFLSEIKRHLKANEKLIELYGALAENPEEWSQDRITIQRANHNIKGPTVWAAGIDSNLVGSHPDMVIYDDVVTRDNITTRESIEKVILRYKDTLDLLEPGGQLIVIGTRWTDGELYDWLMNKDNPAHVDYDVMIKQAYDGNLTTGEGFVPLWPEKFTREELKSRQQAKGWYEFSSQYLNNPIPDEAALFKSSWFKSFDIEDIKGKEMTKVMTIDPAISLDKEADYTAIMVTGIDIFGNIFVLDIARGHYTPREIIDKIFSMNANWNVHSVGIETVAYQKALAYSLKEEMVARRKFLPIEELRPNDRTKDQRIKGLQPSYENGKIFHRMGHHLTPYLEEELIKFPRGRRDDLIDALSYSLDLLFPPRKKTNRYHSEYLY